MKLYNPQHIKLVSNGHGEFPDVYQFTKEGEAMIAEHMGEIVETAYENTQKNNNIKSNDFYKGIDAMKQELLKQLNSL